MANFSERSPRTEAALTELVAAIEAEAPARIIQELSGAVAAAPKRRGRPPRSAGTALALAPKIQTVAAPTKPRKKAPKQFCPVPGCKNLAAPVFGMVCRDHKDVAKSKINKYRVDRKAAKAKK
jgi:hypothetical protein